MMDTDIDNYCIDEFLTILDLDENPTEAEILTATNPQIDKYAKTNPELSDFFIQAQDTLLDEFIPSSIEGKTQQEIWFENQHLPQPNPEQNNKITDRTQQVSFFDASTAMKQQQLGVNNVKQIPVAQGTLNPNLKNTTKCMLNIDSMYRQNINESSTNFTCNLTSELTDVLEMTLYSVNIPKTIYNIDATNGTNSFTLTINSSPAPYIYTIEVESGAYDIETLSSVIQNKLTAISSDLTIDFTNTITGKGSFTNIATDPITLTFYDKDVKNQRMNNNLGWILGFRKEEYTINSGETIVAEAIYNLRGTKCVYIVLNDYSQNRVNGGLVGISSNDTSISLPKYYTNDLSCQTINNNNKQMTQCFP